MEKQPISEKIVNIFIALGISFLAVCVMAIIFKFLFGEESRFPQFSKEHAPYNYLFYMCTIVPFLEEMIFRKLPLSILRRTSTFEENKWYYVALIGIVFGWIHGSIINVYCQGLVGIAFGWVYIKNEHSYLSSVACHSLYNFLVAFIIPVLIK